jgi:hypothetical protein
MADITTMIETLGTSIDPTTRMVVGFCYLIGVWFIWQSIKKLHDMADQRARYGGGGRSFIPLAYGMGGVTLLFLPTFVQVAQNTFFGMSSPISYQNWFDALKDEYGNSVYIMTRLTQLAGLFWFVRGVTLLVQASEPGVQHGPKGLGFLVAGIFAMNLQYTANVVAYTVNLIAGLTV